MRTVQENCSKIAKFTTFIAPVVIGTAAVLSPETASAASCHIYNVNIQGTVASNYGSQNFLVYQQAFWRDAGIASHPVEFVLKPVQDLNAQAQIGNILLMTNSAFANNQGVGLAGYDLGTVSLTNVYNFTLDSGMSFVLPPSNTFVAPGVGQSAGGLGGLGFLTGAGQDLAQIINSAAVLSLSYIIPRNGGGYFYSPDGNWATIAGEINVNGSIPDNATLQGQYLAIFNGNYITSVSC